MTCPTCNDTGYVAVVAKDETGPVLDAPCTCMMGRVQRLREQDDADEAWFDVREEAA